MSMPHLTSSTPRYPRINLPLSLSAATGRQYSNVHTHTPESTHKYIAETIPAVL